MEMVHLYSRNLYQVLEHNDLYFAPISFGQTGECELGASCASQTILSKSTGPRIIWIP